MTRSSAIWATNVEANDLGDDKPTPSRASTSLPFGDTRDVDDDEEEDVFDAEAGCIHYNMAEDENSGRKKPFSCSQLLPLGVGAAICGCIDKMPLPCARKKLSEQNISEAEMELLVAQAMGFLHIDNTTKGVELLLDRAATSITMAPPLSSSTPPPTELAEMTASNAVVAGQFSVSYYSCKVSITGR
jgi:hypothetical protein